jgi:hypothetical protein
MLKLSEYHVLLPKHLTEQFQSYVIFINFFLLYICLIY